MSIDLTGGLHPTREHVFAERPENPEMRDSVSFWVVDDSGAVGLPRIGVEAVSSNWEDHDIQVNVTYPDGRIYRLRSTEPAVPPIGPEGKPTVLGSGGLAFRCVDEFDTWTMTYDGKATGFDTILDNPNFAGGTTSFWQRQQIPFVFGGGVALSGVNSIVPSLRSSKTEGQSNFVNPGLWQSGVGADFDLLPELKLLTNVSYLAWDSTEVLEILRQQERISRDVGWDVSAGLIYRPFFTNNVIFRASGAVLLPGSGYEELFNDRTDEPPYSVLLNLTLTY